MEIINKENYVINRNASGYINYNNCTGIDNGNATGFGNGNDYGNGTVTDINKRIYVNGKNISQNFKGRSMSHFPSLTPKGIFIS